MAKKKTVKKVVKTKAATKPLSIKKAFSKLELVKSVAEKLSLKILKLKKQ